MTLHEAKRNEYGTVRKLYISAFPKEERPPFVILKRKALRSKGTLLVAEDRGEFVGFAYTIAYRDQVYLFFFAVAEERRGQGCGSAILRLLKEYYPGKNIFLAREQLDDNAENRLQRISRHNFYLRSGFSDLPYKIREAGVVYDMMSTGTGFVPDDYNALIRVWAGPVISRIIKMEAFE